MNNGMVSIIIPAYNAEKYLSYTLNSAIGQSYKNLEIIVVDDGSKDKTAELVNICIKNDSRIKCISIENSGVSVARNVGIENSNGEFFMFLDADDLLTEDAVEKMLYAIKNTDSDICCAKSVDVFQNKAFSIPKASNKITATFEGKEFLKKCLQDDPIGWAAWGKIYRSSKFKNIRFVPGRKINEDCFYVFQTAMICPSVVCLDSYLHRYVIHPNGASRADFSEKYLDILYFANEKMRLIKKYYPELYEMTKFINLKANMSLLSNLCRTYDKKWKKYEKQCIKEVIKLKDISKEIKDNKVWFLIIRFHLYGCYKLLFHLFKKEREDEKNLLVRAHRQYE